MPSGKHVLGLIRHASGGTSRQAERRLSCPCAAAFTSPDCHEMMTAEGLLPGRKIGMFSRVYRCEDGHLFTADWGKLVVASSHFGRAKYLQCPVDHRPVMAMPIKGSRLTEEQISQASRYKF